MWEVSHAFLALPPCLRQLGLFPLMDIELSQGHLQANLARLFLHCQKNLGERLKNLVFWVEQIRRVFQGGKTWMESIRAVTWKGQHEEQVPPKCFANLQADHGFFWHSVRKRIPPGINCAMCSPWHVAPPLNKINFSKWQLVNSGEHSRFTLEKPGNTRLLSSNPQTSLLATVNQSRRFLLFLSPHQTPCRSQASLSQGCGAWSNTWYLKDALRAWSSRKSQDSCQRTC